MSQIPKSDLSELITKAKAGDKTARDKIVCDNMGLIGSVVKKFAGRVCDKEDLFQIGAIGLIKAVDKFDLTYGVAFSTYAVPMIIGEIKRFLRDDGIIKVSRSVKELNGKIKSAEEYLTGLLDRKPTVSEISEYMQVDAEDISNAMSAMTAPESLNAALYDDDTRSGLLVDRVACTENEEEGIINTVALKELLGNLPPRERQIIILRYFKESTQSKIAEMLGISQVQVSRIEKKVLGRMKEMLEQ